MVIRWREKKKTGKHGKPSGGGDVRSSLALYKVKSKQREHIIRIIITIKALKGLLIALSPAGVKCQETKGKEDVCLGDLGSMF